MQNFLKMHEIIMEPTPSRSSQKNGIIDRNNGTFKNILAKVLNEKNMESANTMVARASILTNLLHGSAVLNSFQLACGYTLSILGIPTASIPQEL